MRLVRFFFDRRTLTQQLTDAVERGVDLTMKEWVKSISGRSGVLNRAGTGKLYRGGLKSLGMQRRRSARGYPPAVDTGALRRSVTDRAPYKVNTEKVIRRGIIGIKKYGFMLDRGTRRVKPRPWIEPSKRLLAAKVGVKYDRYILGELNRAMLRYLKRRR